MIKSQIPDIIVGRLPRYLRALKVLRENHTTTNSKELGELLGFSAAQIRKDLSQFGEFGKQGTGYDIDFLIERLQNILNIDQDWGILLVGVGKIGRAILNYSGFSANRFHVKAAVDCNPDVIGEKFEKCIVEDIKDIKKIIEDNQIKIAMLAVPAENAQKIAEELVANGIKAILTYAPAILALPPEIQVEYSDPLVSLQHMTYYL